MPPSNTKGLPAWDETDDALRIKMVAAGGTVATPAPGLAQASTATGQLGELNLGLVVTADTVNSAGNVNAITLTVGGRLRVDLASGGTVEPGTAGSISNLVGGVYKSGARALTDGQQASLLLDSASRLVTTTVGNVASGATDNGAPIKVGGLVATATPGAATAGQRKDCWVGACGNIMIGFGGGAGALTGLAAPQVPIDAAGAARPLAAAQYGSNGTTLDAFKTAAGAAASSAGVGVQAVEECGRPYNHISTNATTLVKSGAGFLHSININTKGASGNTATVYDSLSATGSVIAVIDTTDGRETLIYDLAFTIGLTVLTATGTAADITVTYR